MRQGGTMVREMRELLGFSQERLAKIARVSQGAVSRFERGGALSTPWLVAIRLRFALIAGLRRCHPDVLTEDARRFIAQGALYELPDDPALTPPVGAVPEPDLTVIVRTYRRVPDASRAQFVAIMSAVATTLGDGKA